MEPKLLELKTRLAEVYDLTAAAAVLNWDLETYMPSGGAEARAQQLATLQRLTHDHPQRIAGGNIVPARQHEFVAIGVLRAPVIVA